MWGTYTKHPYYKSDFDIAVADSKGELHANLLRDGVHGELVGRKQP